MPHKSEAYYAIDAVIAKCEDGTYLSYEELAVLSGVPMDTEGKAVMRRVIHAQKRVYLCDKGKGIHLVNEQTTIPALAVKAQSVHTSIERTQTTYERVQRFFPKLAEQEFRKAVHVGVVLGYWTATAKMLGSTWGPKQFPGE